MLTLCFTDITQRLPLRKYNTPEEIQYVLLSNLSGTCDRLASSVAATNHHLLGEEDLFCGDLNSQVTTGNHDAIAGFHDLVKSAQKT